MTESPQIELSEVEVAHEDQPFSAVLQVVQWAIRPGERWVVCGGAGSGKTSLLCTGAGLTAPVTGMLRTFGQDYWKIRETDRVALGRRIGFVFDEGGRLFAHMSILENLVIPLQYHSEFDHFTARQRALELLAGVGLETAAHLAPARLTTTLRRRAALARTLTQPVEVLFLDAPLVGLPAEDAQWWLKLLYDLSQREEAAGGPVSIVTSGFDLSSWLEWADHFAILRDGLFQPLAKSEVSAMRRTRVRVGD